MIRLLMPVRGHYNVEGVVEHSHFKDAVDLSGSGEGRARVDFDEPGL